MTRTIRVTAVLMGLGLMLWGCAGGQPKEGLGVPLNVVHFLDKDLDSKVASQSTNARRSPSSTVEVWAVLRNLTNQDLPIECRVQFFDRQQAPTEGPTGWQRLFLAPNALGTYREFSTKVMEVGYYLIEIREVR